MVDFTQPVDKDALNLTRAIGLKEGGGKMLYTNTTGDNGTSKGAYQWQPGNFESNAKEAGLDPTDFSATNQDKVAYAKVKSMKDAGLQPHEIAASWNGGDKNRWDKNYITPSGLPSQGHNAKLNLDYDVPGYVAGVKDYYTKLSGGTTNTPTDPTQSPEVKSHITDMINQGKSHDEVQKYISDIKSGNTPVDLQPGSQPSKIDTLKNGDYIDQVAAEQGAGFQHIKDSIAAGQSRMEKGGIGNDILGAAESGFGTFAGAAQAIFAPATPIVSKLMEMITPTLRQQHPLLAREYDYLAPKLDELAQKNPEAANLTSDIVNTLMVVVGEKLGGKLFPGVEGVEGVNGKNLTPAEKIAATPESKVSKLSTTEQAEYYRQKTVAADKAVKDEIATKTEEVKKEQADLTQKIKEANQAKGDIAVQKANDLKPIAAKLGTDKSNMYVAETNKALDTAEASGFSKDIVTDDLRSQISDHSEDNSGTRDQSILDDLGVKEPVQKVDASGLPIIETNPAIETVSTKKILDTAKGYIKKISKTSLNGAKTYTPDEWELVQKYATLMKVLGDNGVDMTAANKLWSDWAPLRKTINTKIRPFNKPGDVNSTFDQTLITATKETTTANQQAAKIKSQQFISNIETELEKTQGLEPGTLKGTITKEVQDATDKLTEAQKAKIDSQDIADKTIIKLKADLADTKENIKLSKFNTAELAKRKSSIKKAVLWAIGLYGVGTGGTEVIKKLLP